MKGTVLRYLDYASKKQEELIARIKKSKEADEEEFKPNLD
jgi:hypothetical protein